MPPQQQCDSKIKTGRGDNATLTANPSSCYNFPGKRTGYAVKITCPICKTATTWEENPYRPFCSDECKMRDLGKWASEEYRVEGRSQSEEEGKQPEEDEG
jgi:endogenous inhibitor of DNA gyrase (YacG/DUF329 family)